MLLDVGKNLCYKGMACLKVHHSVLQAQGPPNCSKSEKKSGRESHSVESDSLRPHGLTVQSMAFSALNTGVGSLSLLQGIFPTQESNPGFPHCRQILYQVSHQGSQEYWSGLPIPSPGDLPDPGIKPGLLHCRWIRYQPSCHAQPSP